MYNYSIITTIIIIIIIIIMIVVTCDDSSIPDDHGRYEPVKDIGTKNHQNPLVGDDLVVKTH